MTQLPAYRASYGLQRWGGHESTADWVFVGPNSLARPTGTRRPLVILPQHWTGVGAIASPWSSGSADQAYQHTIQRLCEDFVVGLSDFGYIPYQSNMHWGNAQSLTELGAYRNWLGTEFGTGGKIGLLAVSHGSLQALNFAKANPSLVAFVAVIMPALSLANLKARQNELGLDVDGAYGGNYTDAAYGANHSPHYYRHSYPSETVPTAMWTSGNDSVVLGTYAEDFAAANPSIHWATPGAYDHNPAGIVAMLPLALDWIRQFTNEPVAPPVETLGPNLLTAANANAATFDANIGGWVNYYGTLSRTTTASEVRSGAGALKHLSLTVSGYGFYSPYMTITPGQRYRCTGWVKGSGQIKINLFRGSAYIYTNPDTIVLNSTTWQKFEFDYTPIPGETNLVIFPTWQTANSELHMDDVYFGTVT